MIHWRTSRHFIPASLQPRVRAHSVAQALLAFSARLSSSRVLRSANTSRMVRNTGNSSAKSSQFGSSSICSSNGRSPNRKSRKSSGDQHLHLQTAIDTDDHLVDQQHHSSVHKQNFYIVSYPIVLLFNILRSILYQLFLAFRYIFTASSRIAYRIPGRHKSSGSADIKLEVVNTLVNRDSSSPEQQQLLLTTSVTSGGETEDIIGMSSSGNTKLVGPGPGDPLLAKQKHHHRRAFEYISKALKVDENEGKCIIVHLRCIFHIVL